MARTDNDAFGKMLLDHYSLQKPVYYVIERDDGNIDVDNSFGYFSQYDQWFKEEQSIIDQVNSPILDLGCGAGRHSLYLQNKGLDVVALDISPSALSVTKQRGVTKVISGDITALPSFSQKFSSFLLMGNNFGLCGDPRTAKKVLKNLVEIANPNANLIVHFRDPTPNDPNLSQAHREYHEKNREKGIPVGQIKIQIRYQKLSTGWFSFYLPTSEEFTDIIDSTGFWKIEKLIKKDSFVFTVNKLI